ncbi:MAG: AbrB/MazE/SpoVT family DNA-binding domain-containing protein [Nanoarchaeota archaeon]|mgnify:FL=1
MVIEEIVKIGKRGQITLPTRIRKTEHLKEGDFLEMADVGGVITLRRVEKTPTVIDLFKEVGEALKREGITTREKALRLAEEVKREVS